MQVARRYIMAELDALGLHYNPPTANFVLVEVGDARALQRTLLTQYRIGVRDCTSLDCRNTSGSA